MSLEINGKINLGDNWHNLHRDGSEGAMENDAAAGFANVRDSIAKDIKLIAGNKLVDLFKNLNITNIISNLKFGTDEKDEHRKEKHSKQTSVKSEEDTNEKQSPKKQKHHSKGKKHKHDTSSLEDLTRSNKKHDKRTRQDKDNSSDNKKDHRSKHDRKNERENDRSDNKKHDNISKDDKEEKSKDKTEIIKEELVGKVTKMENHVLGNTDDVKAVTTNSTTLKPEITDPVIQIHNKTNLLKPIRVKDDPQLVEHIQHIHTQSLKVINALKAKTDNHKLQKDIDLVLRSYDEKFKQFVKQNKYYTIKSRIGKRKVILNAAEMSNNILDRLVRFVRTKVQAAGLRSGVPNLFHNAIQQKKELENQRMCKKFSICRSRNTYRHFLIDMFTIILNSNDDKVHNFHDAMTEVLKTRDFSKVMESGTEKKFRKAVRHMERYDIMTIRASYFIIRNILEKIHEPIKVTTRNIHSVNRTVAFIDLEDIFEDKIAPNEKNKLEWDDMLTSLRQWSKDERKDIVEIFQTVVDHVTKAIDSFDDETVKKVQINLNKILN